MVTDGEVTSLKGDKNHPANLGRLCSKGAALDQTLDLEGRLLSPVVNGKQADWDTALNDVAENFSRVIKQHGPDAVAFYVSGQLLTEDYYVANKLMKGFIGSANIDTNSRLCMSSSVAGHKRAFGSDTVPCSYTDFESADLVVLTGSNTAWCHPVLFQRLRQAKKDRPQMRVVVIDPRETETCDIADLHLPLAAGSDIALFNGLLCYLEQNNHLDLDFIEQHTNGFSESLSMAQQESAEINQVAGQCQLDPDDLKQFYQWFGDTEKTVTVYSQGVNQWSCGTDKVNSIINCHLATGRIGKTGMGPFSLTGQPNAMGGREVGGLANQLAAHMDFSDESIKLVSDFWNAPNIAEKPGLKAVELFSELEAGKIKALWIMATNPAVSMPQASRINQALANCDYLVVSDCITSNDTTRHANVLLPATTWGEKDGTVTNSERRLSRQRAFLPAPGQARPDWWIICQVAQKMGYTQSFTYQTPADIWREHASLSGYQNGGMRDFDVSALANISNQQYQNMQPQQWPVNSSQARVSSLFSDKRFYHADHKARFISVTANCTYPQTSEQFPLVLNSGRIRDQWHTMTRTGKVARLAKHRAEPYVELHPDDAQRYGISQAQLARVTTQFGDMLAKANISTRQKPGNIFVPMHWSQQNSANGAIGPLVNAVTDPWSGQPQFKHTPAKVTSVKQSWRGFLLSRNDNLKLPFAYWIKRKNRNITRYDIEGDTSIDNWSELVRQIETSDGDWVEFQDKASGYYRAAKISNHKLQCCLFIANDDSLPDDDWLDSLFAEPNLDTTDRGSLLAGRPAKPLEPKGKTICACFDVGLNTIINAIKNDSLTTVEQLGEVLQAGTNCGSCLPELKTIIAEFA